MKNSKMMLDAILNEPENLEAYRAYADALIEEGEEAKGNYLVAKLGKKTRRLIIVKPPVSKEVTFPFTDLTELVVSSPWHIKLQNGFVAHVRMSLFDFMRCHEVLFKSQPIRSIHITSRSPRTLEGRAYWYTGSEEPDAVDYLYGLNQVYWLLPRELMAYFPIENRLDNHLELQAKYICKFGNVRDAIQALSVACVKMGREKAGLLALPGDSYVKNLLANSGYFAVRRTR